MTNPTLEDLTALGFDISNSNDGLAYIIRCQSCERKWQLAKVGVRDETKSITHPGNFLFFVNHSYGHKLGKEKEIESD